MDYLNIKLDLFANCTALTEPSPGLNPGFSLKTYSVPKSLPCLPCLSRLAAERAVGAWRTQDLILGPNPARSPCTPSPGQPLGPNERDTLRESGR
jgi:hypothetical protein